MEPAVDSPGMSELIASRTNVTASSCCPSIAVSAILAASSNRLVGIAQRAWSARVGGFGDTFAILLTAERAPQVSTMLSAHPIQEAPLRGTHPVAAGFQKAPRGVTRSQVLVPEFIARANSRYVALVCGKGREGSLTGTRSREGS